MLCLVQFYDEWNDFSITELCSLLEMNEIAVPAGLPKNTNDQIFVLIDLPNQAVAQAICSRAITINRIIEIWASGADVVSVVDSLEVGTLREKGFQSNYFNGKTWSLKIDSYMRSISMDEKDSYIKCFNEFTSAVLNGPVRLSDPEVPLLVILDHTRNDEEKNSQEVPGSLKRVYFGRLLGKGGMREELRKYDLKKRMYIGPTSLDPSLAFLMANIGKVSKNSIVFDSFVGTGSIIVSLAHLGAVCVGSDIDLRVLNGEMYAGTGDRAIKRGIFQNFHIYGLPIPDLIRLDNHLLDRHFFHENKNPKASYSYYEGVFDAIVTDPPYGIRAGAKKTGKKGISAELSAEHRENHIPPVQTYAVEEVMLDLLHNAARFLRLNGRLVYLIPTTYDFTIDDLPIHPCLSIISTCEQTLSTRHGRRCVTMIKSREYSEEYVAEYARYVETVLAGSDQGFARLKTKLEAALSTSAFTNDSVVKQISKSCMKRRKARERHISEREASNSELKVSQEVN